MKHFREKLAISLIFKGIAVEDAATADERGRQAGNLSNHGGHQLDHGRGISDVMACVREKGQ